MWTSGATHDHRSRCGVRASVSFPPLSGQFASDDAKVRLRRYLANRAGKIAATLGAMASRVVVTSPLSPASIGGLEHARPCNSPVENGVLDGPEHVHGEERNEEMARDVVHSFHELVHVSVRSHR